MALKVELEHIAFTIDDQTRRMGSEEIEAMATISIAISLKKIAHNLEQLNMEVRATSSR